MATNASSGVDARYAGLTLFFVLILPCFVSPEVGSIVLLGVFVLWLIFSQGRIGKGFLVLAAPFALFLFIGSVGALLYPPRDVLKDVWYVGKVIVALGVGFVLARYVRDFSDAVKVVVLASVFAAIFHISEILRSWQPGVDLFQLRQHAGIVGYFVTVIGLAFLVSFPRSTFRMGRALYFLCLFICAVSVVLAFSRTYIIALLLMIIVLRGWASFTVKGFARIGSVILLGVLTIIMFSGSWEVDSGTLVGKFADSFEEVSVRNYSDIGEISRHWRGFESYRAIVDFWNGSVLEKMFGQGLGATVDLGINMVLGGNEIRYAPVLHNGYLYVLVKFGLVGLIIYGLFLVRLLASVSYVGKDTKWPLEYVWSSRVAAAFGWVLVFSSLVIAGVFNKGMMFSLLVLLGLFFGLRSAGTWRPRE